MAKKNKDNNDYRKFNNDNETFLRKVERILNVVCLCGDKIRLTTRDKDKSCPSCGRDVENPNYKNDNINNNE